jgi:hypothetical protein
MDSRSNVIFGPFIIILLTVPLLFFSSKMRSLRKGIIWVSDRLTIFLFILLPLFVFLSAYAIFRNLG